MKRFLLLIFLSVTGLVTAQAQVVQWANKVLDFSTELTAGQYSAQQALGKPNVISDASGKLTGGQSPSAWTPDRPNRKEFLKLGFANPIQIQQVAIAESHNPSALYRVLAYDEAGNEYELMTLNPQVVPLKSRMLNIFVEKTSFKVAAIKLEFDGAAVGEYFGIDAVAISDSKYAIIPEISKPELLAAGLTVQGLDEKVNSEYSELNPLLSPDGKTLYFSRKNHPENVGGITDKEDIWYSELDSTGRWKLAQNLTPLNNPGPNFINYISSVTPDGKSAIVLLGNQYNEKGKMLAGVSVSTNVGGNWTKPAALKITDDYNFSEKVNYFMANNRRTLLMSVEREDSEGDRDLYVSFQNADSTWTKPLNLGKNVNTASEEASPFLAADDKTLYFSSKGFSGYGGSDIYMSKRLDDTWTSWSEPQNLGPEINSPQEDVFFNIPANSDYAYYSRGITETNTDIYRVKLPIMNSPELWVTVKGKLIDGKTGLPIAAKIIYERLPDGVEAGITQTNPATGEYEMRLPAGFQYGVRAEAKDHISENQNLDLRNVKGDQVLDHQDFKLKPMQVETIAIVPIEENAKIVLNNIFFDFDSHQLRENSKPELNRIVAMMKERAGMQVEIAGHTDANGPEAYNQKLSERRAKAVNDYLSSQGIDSSRIVVTFFGEQKPIADNKTKEGQRKNRRVEFKIVKP
ncbi:MAG: OmpA family protein [Cyclobacteriaceae bacterium]|nr:OmpA family protein [Cyclobacteriaceae bacterium]